MIKVLSLGAGVQSTALAYLYENGELEGPPDFAIFADTQAEPQDVYDNLNRIKQEIKKFPVIVTTRGNLGDNPGKVPLFLKHENGKKGIGRRQCTSDFKIVAVEQEIRKQLGYKRGQHMKHFINVQLGISTDEMERMKESKHKWQKNEWPLIDILGFSRKDCVDYCKKIGIAPPRSACFFCPYRSNAEWLEMKKNQPGEFEKACLFDEKIRKNGGFTNYRGEQYVHSSLKPLREANLERRGKYSMRDECDGMCGV